MAMVWNLVWWWFEEECQNDWSVQQSENKGTQADWCKENCCRVGVVWWWVEGNDGWVQSVTTTRTAAKAKDFEEIDISATTTATNHLRTSHRQWCSSIWAIFNEDVRESAPRVIVSNVFNLWERVCDLFQLWNCHLIYQLTWSLTVLFYNYSTTKYTQPFHLLYNR